MAESKIPCPAPVIDWGYIDEGTVPPSNGENQTTTGFEVLFSKEFSGAPFVLAVAQSNNRAWGSNIFYVTRVADGTATGCNIHVANLGTADIELSQARCIKWIALGY